MFELIVGSHLFISIIYSSYYLCYVCQVPIDSPWYTWIWHCHLFMFFVYLCIWHLILCVSEKFIDITWYVTTMARVLSELEYELSPTNYADSDVSQHLLCRVEECPTCLHIISVRRKGSKSSVPNPLVVDTSIKGSITTGRGRLSLVFAR